MRIYSIDTLGGDHIEFSLNNECWNEYITVTDIDEVYTKSEIKEIIDEDFPEWKEELYEEYEI